MTLRPATANDQSAIRQLIKEGGINPFGLNWQRFVVVQNADGEIVGCGQLKPHGKQTIELASIAVTRSHRKQGIARLIIEYLKTQHAPPIWLMCGVHLESFYTSFGFVRIYQLNEMPRYFRRITRLTGIFGRFTDAPNSLAIMVWRGTFMPDQ